VVKPHPLISTHIQHDDSVVQVQGNALKNQGDLLVISQNHLAKAIPNCCVYS
jgi:hypothetical protein